MSGQSFVSMGEGRPRPWTYVTPTMYAAGDSLAAWGAGRDYPPVISQSAPIYAPSPFAPVFRNAPMPFQPGEQQYGRPYQLDVIATLTGIYNQYIAPNLLLIAALGVGGAIFLYAMSKPTVRGRATEYAARGGVAMRSGLGGARDVGSAAIRGFREGTVPGLTPEEVEEIIQESRKRREQKRKVTVTVD